jgi:hypothetical protein
MAEERNYPLLLVGVEAAIHAGFPFLRAAKARIFLFLCWGERPLRYIGVGVSDYIGALEKA